MEISFFPGFNETIRIVWNRSKPVLTRWKGKTKVYWSPNFTKNSIIRNYNSGWSFEHTIFILHDLRVGYITEQLYFYSKNSPFQWVFLIVTGKPSVLPYSLVSQSVWGLPSSFFCIFAHIWFYRQGVVFASASEDGTAKIYAVSNENPSWDKQTVTMVNDCVRCLTWMYIAWVATVRHSQANIFSSFNISKLKIRLVTTILWCY